jgi:ATP-dependent Clp protease, protease subunit
MVHSSLVPMVIDNTGGGERAFDIYSLLLKERIVFLNTDVNDVSANLIVAQLLYLSSVDPKSTINLYIHSPGGIVYSGMAIFDTMRMIPNPVSTVAVGFTGSMATFLLSAGTKGKRYALPHATIHNHPAGGGARGYTEDVLIATREQERIQAQLSHLMGKFTGHTRAEVEEFFRRDRYLNAQEALEFGLVDEILGDTSDLVVLNRTTPQIELWGSPKILQAEQKQ